MASIKYATIYGKSRTTLQFITLLEHKKHSLTFSPGWDVHYAFYGYYDKSRTVQVEHVFHKSDDTVPSHTNVAYENFDPDRCCNVTDIVKRLWDARKPIRAKNALFGDPCYKRKKMLFIALEMIEYSYQELEGTSWIRTWNHEYERYYFYNVVTAESSWHWPNC